MCMICGLTGGAIQVEVTGMQLLSQYAHYGFFVALGLAAKWYEKIKTFFVTTIKTISGIFK